MQNSENLSEKLKCIAGNARRGKDHQVTSGKGEMNDRWCETHSLLTKQGIGQEMRPEQDAGNPVYMQVAFGGRGSSWILGDLLGTG